ncbi:hypothetical protein L218DRAFT_881254 [Marasmius fiardii PR-910]|nr:hypothetical protein L218DRAFT_881254 [Marasmius fiardii PR-910]
MQNFEDHFPLSALPTSLSSHCQTGWDFILAAHALAFLFFSCQLPQGFYCLCSNVGAILSCGVANSQCKDTGLDWYTGKVGETPCTLFFLLWLDPSES